MDSSRRIIGYWFLNKRGFEICWMTWRAVSISPFDGETRMSYSLRFGTEGRRSLSQKRAMAVRYLADVPAP